MAESAAVISAVIQKFSAVQEGAGEKTSYWLNADKVIEALTQLKAGGFEVMTFVTATDDLGKNLAHRFTIVYQLMHKDDFSRLRLKSAVRASETHPSVTGIFPAANFAEREIYDMFGIQFENHPDLRRLLCPDDFEGFPLRKDFPLQGKGYRFDFPNYNRDLLNK